MRVLTESRGGGFTRYMVVTDSWAGEDTGIVDCVDVSADGRQFNWQSRPSNEGMAFLLAWLRARGSAPGSCAKVA